MRGMDTCTHPNTKFDPATHTVVCKDCGKVVAKVKPKTKKMIRARRKK